MAQETFTVTNNSANPVDALFVEPSGGSGFGILSSSCFTQPLAAGDSCTFDVEFTGGAGCASGLTSTFDLVGKLPDSYTSLCQCGQRAGDCEPGRRGQPGIGIAALRTARQGVAGLLGWRWLSVAGNAVCRALECGAPVARAHDGDP
jgi:hypothetical protein